MVNIKNRIEEIEYALWIMEFKDHWTPADWTKRDQLNAELYQLKTNLAKAE